MVMVILSALLQRLEDVELITAEERKDISSLYSLTLVLQNKVGKYFNEEEQRYLDIVNALLKEGNVTGISKMEAPVKLRKYHKTLMEAVSIFKSI